MASAISSEPRAQVAGVGPTSGHCPALPPDFASELGSKPPSSSAPVNTGCRCGNVHRALSRVATCVLGVRLAVLPAEPNSSQCILSLSSTPSVLDFRQNLPGLCKIFRWQFHWKNHRFAGGIRGGNTCGTYFAESMHPGNQRRKWTQ